MIISRTPLRISFAGGGTDLKVFYERYGGCVISTAIDKYLYVTVNKKFDDQIRISYSKTEIVDNVDLVQHGIVRESLKYVGIRNGIEITTIADVPGKGSGLGSSSSLTVGLLNALNAYKGKHISKDDLASDACEVEVNILKSPIGKQDQYIASFGGLEFITFNKDDTVHVDPVICSPDTRKEFNERLLLFYLGKGRESNVILSDQKEKSLGNADVLKRMKEHAHEIRRCLQKDDVDSIGEILDETWKLKKTLAKGVSDKEIDAVYRRARSAGATGGKVTGAGGGGFMLLYCPIDSQKRVKRALPLKEMPFSFEPEGSKIIFYGK